MALPTVLGGCVKTMASYLSRAGLTSWNISDKPYTSPTFRRCLLRFVESGIHLWVAIGLDGSH